MSTRSTIARQNEDGSFDAIYCHFDGYPEHVGRLLLQHYNHPAKVDELIALGDLSSLGETIGSQHPFDHCPDGECNAYGRDRGEPERDAKHLATVQDLALYASLSLAEFLYLYRDGAWWYCRFTHLPDLSNLAPLTPEAAAVK